MEVLSLARAAFTRLVGKCSRIIQRNAQLYEETTAQLAETELSVTKLIETLQVACNACATVETEEIKEGHSERNFDF